MGRRRTRDLNTHQAVLTSREAAHQDIRLLFGVSSVFHPKNRSWFTQRTRRTQRRRAFFPNAGAGSLHPTGERSRFQKSFPLRPLRPLREVQLRNLGSFTSRLLCVLCALSRLNLGIWAEPNNRSWFTQRARRTQRRRVFFQNAGAGSLHPRCERSRFQKSFPLRPSRPLREVQLRNLG